MKEIKKLKSEIYENAPELQEKIKAGVNWERVAENCENPREKSRKILFKRIIPSLSAACLAVIAVVSVLFNSFKKPAETFSYDVIISVNPCVAFTVDKNDTVTMQRGMNEDGSKILINTDYKGKSIEAATEGVIAEMIKCGIINNETNVGISANKHGTKIVEESKLNAVERFIYKAFENSGVTGAQAVCLSDSDIDEIEDYYDKNKHKLSEEEKLFIEEFYKNLTIAVEEKINDIENLINELKPYKKYKFKDLSEELKVKVNDFCKKYRCNENIDEIEEFLEYLEENKEDLEEGLEEIKDAKSDGDYGEAIEEMAELLKEKLFSEKDGD